MRKVLLLSFICGSFVFFVATSVARAGTGAMLTSVDGTSEQVSRAHIFGKGFGSGPLSHLSVTDVSMILGPAFNTLSTEAPSSSRPYSGIGTRHLLHFDYALSDRVSLAPTLDVTNNFYDSKQGRLIFNDPSLRLAINDVTQAEYGRARLRAALWISAFAPTSQVSQEQHRYGALAVAYVSRIHLIGSRFSFAGIGRLKAEALQNLAHTRNLVLGSWLVAEEVDYRAGKGTTCFLMNHVNGNLGPHMVLVSGNLSSQNYRKKLVADQSVFDYVMLGVKFGVASGVEISPRLDWLINLPVSSTTLGLNAAFHLI